MFTSKRFVIGSFAFFAFQTTVFVCVMMLWYCRTLGLYSLPTSAKYPRFKAEPLWSVDPRWSKMVQDGPRWSKMVQDGPRISAQDTTLLGLSGAESEVRAVPLAQDEGLRHSFRTGHKAIIKPIKRAPVTSYQGIIHDNPIQFQSQSKYPKSNKTLTLLVTTLVSRTKGGFPSCFGA